MAFEQERTIYAFMKGYGETLLAEMKPGDEFIRICEGGHHPMWIIGHLAIVGHDWSKKLGGAGATTYDGAWWSRLGQSLRTPAIDADKYPPFTEVVGAWRSAHAAFDAAAAQAPQDVLARPSQGPVSSGLPTVRDFVAFLLTAHEGMHLSQLSTWRRTRGMPPLF